MRKLILFCSICVLNINLWAQGNTPTSTGFTVNAVSTREVEPAYRMLTYPSIIDTVIPRSTVQFPLLALKYQPEIKMDTITPAVIKLVDKLPQIYNSYVKVGIGYELMPMGELYYNNTRSRKYNYGANIKHLSSFGNVKGYAPSRYDRTSIGAYGSLLEKKYRLDGDLSWSGKGLHWYGLENEDMDRDSIRQRFSTISSKVSYTSYIKDSNFVNYRVGLEYANHHDLKSKIDSLKDWNGRENYVGVKSSFWYQLNEHLLEADLNIKYNGYRYGTRYDSLSVVDTALFVNNTIIELKPRATTRALNGKLEATVGVNITLESRGENKIYLYPIVEAKYALFDDIFIAFAGVKGNLNQTTFRSLSGQNEFVLSNLNLLNEHNALDFYFGVKGSVSKNIGFNVNASFANYKNKALFVLDTVYSMNNRFDVLYDTMNVTKIQGSIYYQMNEKLKITAIANYYSYNPKNESYAWNLPQFTFTARGSYNLYDKFIFHLDAHIETGRMAKVYADEPGAIFENNQYARKLGTIVDCNLSAEYRYSNRLSGFINFNNFAAQRYKRWMNYPVQGFQVMVGASYKF